MAPNDPNIPENPSPLSLPEDLTETTIPAIDAELSGDDDAAVDFGSVASVDEGASGFIPMSQLSDEINQMHLPIDVSPMSSAEIDIDAAIPSAHVEPVASVPLTPEDGGFLETTIPAAHTDDDAGVDFNTLAALGEGASGVIPIAELPESPSGQSMTSWTEIIRRQREANQDDAAIPAAMPVQVDAPSDAHILGLVATDGSAVPPVESDVMSFLPLPETSEIPQADLPVFGEPDTVAADSAADLARFLPPSPLGAAGSSAVQFDVDVLPPDAGGAMPLPNLSSFTANDGLDFQHTDPVERLAAKSFFDDPDAGESNADIGRSLPPMPPSETSRSSILDALLSDGNPNDSPLPRPNPSEPEIDLASDFPTPMAPSRLAQLPPPAFVPPRTAPPTAPSFEIPDVSSNPSRSGSAWNLNIPGHESGRLMEIAQESDRDSDEAVDLYAGAAPTPSITDSGSLAISDEVIEEAQRRSQLMESSAVDLGSRPSFHDSDFEAAFQKQQLISNPAPMASPASDADIDLGMPTMDDETNSSMVRNRDQASQSNALTTELESRRRQRGTSAEPSRVIANDGRKRGRGVLIGTAAGLFVGAGSVLGLHFGNVLPNKATPNAGNAPIVADQSAELTKLKQEVDDAKAAADAAQLKADVFASNVKKSLTDAGVANPDNVAEAIQALASAKTTSDATIKSLMTDAEKAKADVETAKKAAEDALKVATTAKNDLTDAMKAVTAAKAEAIDLAKQLETAKTEAETAKKTAIDAKKTADDSLAALTKALKDAGADAPKLEDGIKKLIDARAVAEAKEKEALAKADAASKKEADLQKLADAAKAAELAARKDAEAAKLTLTTNEATLKTLGERLAKAKFVAENPNTEALLKGIDDVIKVATTDATTSLRDELAKAREREAKLKTDVTAAQAKEAESVKMVATLKAEANKLMTDLAGIAEKHANETKQLKADVAKMTQELANVNDKIDQATKAAQLAKAEADKATGELTKAKTDNERLTRELESVKELANTLKNSAGTVIVNSKIDPQRIGERSFNEALTAFHAGKYDEAEKGFLKAIQINPGDARYHYLLGITMWVRGNQKAAADSFTRGQQLEVTGRPPRKMIADVLENIQGAPRQALNAYRP